MSCLGEAILFKFGEAQNYATADVNFKRVPENTFVFSSKARTLSAILLEQCLSCTRCLSVAARIAYLKLSSAPALFFFPAGTVAMIFAISITVASSTSLDLTSSVKIYVFYCSEQ